MVRIQVFDDYLWVDAGKEKPVFLEVGILSVQESTHRPPGAAGEQDWQLLQALLKYTLKIEHRLKSVKT